MMKFIYTAFLVIGILTHFEVLAQGIAINNDNSVPDPSAMLDVKSTDKGFLIPRMTKDERELIVSPATGLMIYTTTNPTGLYYNSGTSENPDWLRVGTGSGWGLTGNAGTSGTSNFIGTTDDASLVFKVNNLPAGKIDHLLFNTSLGYQSLGVNTTGISNTATGHSALYSNTTGDNNTANGQDALYSNTYGDENTATGHSALFSNTFGLYNTANGSGALYNNTSGFYNTAIGRNALNNNTGGDDNTANGSYALFSNTSGVSNTATGSSSLWHNTTGHFNTASGERALYDNTSGRYNTANGNYALHYNITGDYNTGLGDFASFDNTGLDNTTCIGYISGGVVNASNRVEIGNTSVSVIAGQVGFSTYSDERIKDNIAEDVPGLVFINQLRPVTYNLNIHRQNEMVYKGTKKDKENWDSKYDIELIRMTGFIAQEVEKASTESGYDFSGLQKPANPDELYSLRYSDFVVPLVKAVQELNAKNEELIVANESQKVTNQNLKTQIEKLMQRIDKLENK